MALNSILVALLVTFFVDNGVCGPFSGDKVIRIVPKTVEQLDMLINIERTEPLRYDFWQYPGDTNKPVDIHVKHQDYKNLTSLLQANNIKYEYLMYDLQAKLDHQNDQPPSIGPMSWHTRYHPFDEIAGKLLELVNGNPGKATAELSTIGKTIENREQFIVKIKGASTFADSNSKKPAIFITCGVHAREWVGPATCVYMIDQLINKYGKDASVTATLDKMDFIILPVVNADGYVFSWKKGNRLWRKNRKPPTKDDKKSCYGVDLNRNFPYNWGKQGVSSWAASDNPCSEIYDGASAASEIEVQNIVNFATSTTNLKSYLDIHAYSQMWLLPWGYTKKPSPDHKELLRVANIAANKLKTYNGTAYEVGSSSTLLYATTGTTKDFMYGQLKVPYTYVLELRDKGWHGFILPASAIVDTARETFGAIQAMVAAMDMNYVTNF